MIVVLVAIALQSFPAVKSKMKKADHSCEANKAYREDNLGCQDALRPFAARTHWLADG